MTQLSEAQRLNDLLRENAALTEGVAVATPAAAPYRIYVLATLIAAAIAVCAIVVIAIKQPQNTSTGTLVLGILLPIITAFLAASIGHVGAAVDGRLSQLLVLTARAKNAEGRLAALAEAGLAANSTVDRAADTAATVLTTAAAVADALKGRRGDDSMPVRVINEEPIRTTVEKSK